RRCPLTSSPFPYTTLFRSSRLSARECAQWVQGARARSLAPGGSEGAEAEGAGEMDHQLARADVQALAHFADGMIGDGEQDQIDVAQRRRFQPAAALPGR